MTIDHIAVEFDDDYGQPCIRTLHASPELAALGPWQIADIDDEIWIFVSIEQGFVTLFDHIIGPACWVFDPTKWFRMDCPFGGGPYGGTH